MNVQTKAKINAIAVFGDKLLCATSRGTVNGYNLPLTQTAKPIAQFVGHTGPVTTVAVDRETKQIWTGGWDSKINCYPLRSVTVELVEIYALLADFV